MTIIEHAIRDIERRQLEQHARIEEARRALVLLEQEKQQILAAASRAGLSLDRQLRDDRE
jgi:hypothetical protein